MTGTAVAAGRELPSGVVTFVFTDIEGSTRLFQEQGDRYLELLADHHRILRAAFDAHGGHEVKTEGDAFFMAFASASAAAAACLDAQLGLAAHPWPEDAVVRVRMGVHTGEAVPIDDDYVALTVHQAARVAACGHGGQVLLSAATAELVDALPEGATLLDLGEHKLKDLSRHVRLHQLDHPGLAHDFPPLRSLDRPTNNLPASLTSFVGRHGQADELMQLLAPDRVVTLTGAGGSGKTRLAVEVGRRLVDKFPDGVWFVDLAGSAGDGVVVTQAAAALGLPTTSQTRLEALAEYVRHRSMLVILDNCEHLLRATAELVDALTSSGDGVRVLATSREPLGARGERVWLVPSLDVSVDGDAVELFLERAVLARRGLRLEGDEREVVARICERLDGLPLAVELAAARCRVLSVEEIWARLSDRFRLLTGGSNRDLGRQQTLRATVDWSHDLLDEPERTLLRRMAAFPGGCTLDAVEATCAGGPVDELDILDVLTRLVDKSMVVVDPGDHGFRYRMLETVREYAGEKLVHSGEADDLRTAHLRWFADLGRQADAHLWGADDLAWLRRVDAEVDNIRAALAWATAVDPVTAMTLVADLLVYWWVRGMFEEGRGHAEAALAAWEQVDGGDDRGSVAAARAHATAGFMSYGMTDRVASKSHAEAAIAIDERLGRPPALTRLAGWAMTDLADVQRDAGDVEAARATLALAHARATATEDTFLRARVDQQLAHLIFNEDQERAVALVDRGVEACRAIGNGAAICRLVSSRGMFASALGDDVAALRDFSEVIEIASVTGDVQAMSSALLSYTVSASALGRYAEAADVAIEALAAWGRRSGHALRPFVLNTVGWTWLTAGRWQSARRALEEAGELVRWDVPTAMDRSILHSVAEARRLDGDLDGAEAAFEACLGAQDPEDAPGLSAISTLVHVVLGSSAHIALARGQVDVACDLVAQSLEHVGELPMSPDLVRWVDAVAAVLVALSQATEAATALSFADAAWVTLDLPPSPLYEAEHIPTVAACTTALGEAAYETAAQRGASMPWPDLLALVGAALVPA